MFRFLPSEAGFPPEASLVRNRLLAALAPEDLARLRPHLELATPGLGEVLATPGQVMDCVLLPEAGIVSVLAAPTNDHRKVEIGLIGREGVVGPPVVLGVDVSPSEYLVQADARAWRLPL